MSIWHYLLLFVTGLAAGVMNTVGGGGSVLTLPALIFIGLPADIANATNRIGIFAQNVVAVREFRRNHVYETGLTWRVAVLGVMGAVIGALIAGWMPVKLFERVLGWLMLALLALIVFRPRPKFVEGEAAKNAWLTMTRPNRIVAAVVFFFLGIYSGFMQAGVGIMILVVLGHVASMDLVRANYVKLVYILVCMPVALATFIAAGVDIHWLAGFALTAGQMIGARGGSWVAIHKGEKWILGILVVCILLSSAKLLEWI